MYAIYCHMRLADICRFSGGAGRYASIIRVVAQLAISVQGGEIGEMTQMCCLSVDPVCFMLKQKPSDLSMKHHETL